MKTDMRFTILYDEATGKTSMKLKRAKYSDEAKYKIAVESESGEELDFTGFSVFVKGECSAMAMRTLGRCSLWGDAQFGPRHTLGRCALWGRCTH